MSTPAPQDLFSRFQAGIFDETKLIAVPTGFQAFFGNPADNSETIFSPDANQVDIDIIRGNERISALIPRGGVSRSLGSTQKNLKTERFSSFSRKYPLVEEEGDITGDQLLQRIAGENPYDVKTRMTRLRHHAAKIHAESIRKMGRLFETLAAQSILTGVQDAGGGEEYNFYRKAAHMYAVDTSWSGGSGAIMADVDAACAKIRASGHVTADMMVLGSTAMNSIVEDTTVAALADNRRFTYISFGPNNAVPPKFARFITGGFIPQGTLNTPNGNSLTLFTYLDVYTDSAGNATVYLPADTCLITYSGARCDRYFGPPENLPMTPMKAQLYREFFGFDPNSMPTSVKMKEAGNIIDPAMFYSDAYVSSDWKKISIRTQSAPIFATTQTDAFVVLDTEP